MEAQISNQNPIVDKVRSVLHLRQEKLVYTTKLTEGRIWLKRLSYPKGKVWTPEEIHNSKKLSKVEEVISTIAENNYKQTIPTQKELVNEFGEYVFYKKFCALEEDIAGSVTIPEIILHVGLEVLDFRNDGSKSPFHPPKKLEWLGKYLKKYGHASTFGQTWNSILKHPRARYDCHWIANVMVNGVRCYDPLSLHLYQPEILSYGAEPRIVNVPLVIKQI